MSSLCCPQCGREVLILRRASPPAAAANPSAPAPPGAPIATRVPLTPRQRQIVALVKRGLLNKEIAWKLHISLSAVKNQLHSIFDQVTVFDGVRITNRHELTLWALRLPASFWPAEEEKP